MDVIQEFGYIVALEEFNAMANNFDPVMESNTNVIEKLLKNAWELIRRAIKGIIDIIGNIIKAIKRRVTGSNVYMRKCDIEYVGLMMSDLRDIDSYINDLPNLDKELRMSDANDLMDDVNNILANVVEKCKNIEAIAQGNVRISNEDTKTSLAVFPTDSYATKFTDLRNKWGVRLHDIEYSPYLHGSTYSPKAMHDNDDDETQTGSYSKLMNAGRHIAIGMQKTYNQAMKATGVVSKFIDTHMKFQSDINAERDAAREAVNKVKKENGI